MSDSSSNNDDGSDKDITPFLAIVQCDWCLLSLEYHAFNSCWRVASSSETYRRNRRNQWKSSAYISRADPSDPSSLVYAPNGGGIVTVDTADWSPIPYTVSTPSLVVRGTGARDDDMEVTLTNFHDNPCGMESTTRHPGTTMESDCEED